MTPAEVHGVVLCVVLATIIIVSIFAFFVRDKRPTAKSPDPQVQAWIDRRKAGESIYSIARSEGMRPSQLVERVQFEKDEPVELLDAIFDLQNRVSKLEGK
jgi:hypothetical protein